MAKTAVPSGSIRGPSGAPWSTVRTVTDDTIAVVGEALWVDATDNPRAILLPDGVAGERLFAGKADDDDHPVRLVGTVNRDPQGVELTSAGAGATLLHDGTGWWIESVTTTPTGRHTATVVTVAYAATIPLDATAGSTHRCSLTGDPTIAVPTGGTDAGELTVELHADGADRTATFDGGYELGENITDRAVTVTAGRVATIRLRCRVDWPATGTVWRLLALDRGTDA